MPSVHTENLPRSVYAAVAGLACLPVGLLWDISHHSTIGRDTFWTPAHILIQLGGIVPALLFSWIALQMTWRGTQEQEARDSSVSFWGLRAPLGVWVTIWGALAMMTQAPETIHFERATGPGIRGTAVAWTGASRQSHESCWHCGQNLLSLRVP